MILKMKCPGCRAKIAFDDKNKGKKMECPECGAEVKVVHDPDLNGEKNMADKKERETKKEKEDILTDKTETETDQLEAVEDNKPVSDEIEHDIEETSSNEPISQNQREPWSILDIPLAFKAAGNGTALLISMAVIFVILVTATIPRFVAVSFESAMMGYIFNGITLLVLILGFSIGMGTLSRMHNHVLNGNKSFSIADTTGYFFTHAVSLVLSPLKMIIITAVLTGIEIFIFYLCKIPLFSFLYGILFFPLFILTFIVLCMCIALFIMINLSSTAVGVDSFSGNGAFEKAHAMLKKKTGKVIGYNILNSTAVGLLVWGIIWVGLTVFAIQETQFVDKILDQKYTAEELAARTEPVPLDQGEDHYKSAKNILLGSKGKQPGVNMFKGIIFLISMYLTLAFLFAFPFSLLSSLNTVCYLALKEKKIEV